MNKNTTDRPVKWRILTDLVDYESFIIKMEEHVAKLIKGETKETIYLLEHKPTYTAGISTTEEELSYLNNNKAKICNTKRGGKITYHGPGQRVIYPIIKLSSLKKPHDLHFYIRNIEEWIILTLKYFDVHAFTIKDKIGIWVNFKDEDRKIASIGIRVRKWVAYHGIAVNISTDMSYYQNIIACGLPGKVNISLNEINPNIIKMNDFDHVLKKTSLIFFS